MVKTNFIYYDHFKDLPSDILNQIKILDLEIQNPWNDQQWHHCNEAYHFIVCLNEKNELIAFVLFLHHPEHTEEAELLKIVVGEKFLQQGYGKTIFKKMCDYLTNGGARKIFLEVSSLNQSALNFYLNHDFKTLRKMKNYYGKDHDAFSMVKELDEESPSVD